MKTKNIIIILFLAISCVSSQEMTQKRMQKEVYRISEQFFISQIKFIKKDTLWINAVTDSKLSLGLFKTIPKGFESGKTLIETHIKDSVLRREILSKENIDFFKKQLSSVDGHKLITKKLSQHPKISVVTGNVASSFYMGKDVLYISHIMFTKDGKYALFYSSKQEGTRGLWVYKKDNKRWKYYKAFHVGIS